MSDNNNNITLILAFSFGVIITYLLFKNKTTTLQSTQNSQSQLQQPNYESVNIQNSHYKNNEKWHIIRDENGNLIDIEVMRDAKITS